MNTKRPSRTRLIARSPIGDLQDISVDAPETREFKVTAATCPLLSLHRIAHVGWAKTPAPYRRVRRQPSGSYLLVCIAGRGRILLDGRWRFCEPGMACLAPPRVPNAFHATSGTDWEFCWVRYFELSGTTPVVSAASPVKTTCDPLLLSSAIRGLWAEARGEKDPQLLHHWAELVHGEALRLARPWQVDGRLGQIWTTVAADLSHPWDVSTLAQLAHCSPEHLRRLCLRELGRTPLQQVTYLRVQHAAERLQQGKVKLTTVAEEIGYSDAFAFSKIFKRWFGCAPSEYRKIESRA